MLSENATRTTTSRPIDYEFEGKYTYTVHVTLSLELFMGLTLGFILLMLVVMAAFRWYYRRQLEVRLKELQVAYEPGRVFLIENAGNEVIPARPGPLSPPLSDQTEYNVVAGYLRDDRRGHLF